MMEKLNALWELMKGKAEASSITLLGGDIHLHLHFDFITQGKGESEN